MDVEIANVVEAVQDGRIFIARVNGPFLAEGGTPDQFRAADEVSNFCATACGVGDRFQTIADHAKRKHGNTADTSVSAVIGALAAGFLGT